MDGTRLALASRGKQATSTPRVAWPVRQLVVASSTRGNHLPSLAAKNKGRRNSTPVPSRKLSTAIITRFNFRRGSDGSQVRQQYHGIRASPETGRRGMFVLPTAQGCHYCPLHGTGSKLGLTSCIRSSATMNSQRVPTARPMARTASTSPWKVPQATRRLRRQRDAILAGRSEAHPALQDTRPTPRRRPGNPAQRMCLPRNTKATRHHRS